MAEPARETIRKLVRLREMDEKLQHLEQRLQDGPRILGLRKAELDTAHEAVERQKEEIRNCKLASKERENELKKKEEEIKKQEVHLLTTKKMSNEEYQAHQAEIKRLKQEAGELEEAILLSFDRVEEAERGLTALEREMAARREEYEVFGKEVEKDMAAYEEEIAALKKEREALAETVDFEALKVYERVRSARDGVAVVPVEGNNCGGCHMTVTPNDLARLQGLQDIVLCKSCQRILYLPDTIG